MKTNTQQRALAFTVGVTLVSACAQIAEGQVQVPLVSESQSQKWVSTMTISSDCGVVPQLNPPVLEVAGKFAHLENP